MSVSCSDDDRSRPATNVRAGAGELTPHMTACAVAPTIARPMSPTRNACLDEGGRRTRSSATANAVPVGDGWRRGKPGCCGGRGGVQHRPAGRMDRASAGIACRRRLSTDRAARACPKRPVCEACWHVDLKRHQEDPALSALHSRSRLAIAAAARVGWAGPCEAQRDSQQQAGLPSPTQRLLRGFGGTQCRR